jgi:hypothetical protein
MCESQSQCSQLDWIGCTVRIHHCDIFVDIQRDIWHSDALPYIHAIEGADSWNALNDKGLFREVGERGKLNNVIEGCRRGWRIIDSGGSGVADRGDGGIFADIESQEMGLEYAAGIQGDLLRRSADSDGDSLPWSIWTKR